MKPFMRVPLREFIIEELKERNWNARDLIRTSGLKRNAVLDLIHSNRVIVDNKIAVGLSKAFGQSKEYWLKLGRICSKNKERMR